MSVIGQQIYAPNMMDRWKVMPIELRNSFVSEFTEGIRNPENRLIPPR